MKTYIKNPLLLPALIAVLNLIPAGRVTAQTFTTLYSFTASSTNASGSYTNSDGANPFDVLVLSSNTLYGTARYDGSSGYGTVFAVKTDGSDFATLHSFTTLLSPPVNTNNDGAYPSGLILSGDTLYGTAGGGGDSGNGTLFAVNTDGSGFTNLHSFTATSTNSSGAHTNSDGTFPNDRLLLSGNTLYGTAQQGGGSGAGTVFVLNTDGTSFTNLHSFSALSSGTNNDGAYPIAGLILSGNTLYGTASRGGSSFGGTVFAVNTDGTGFTNLHSFTALSASSSHTNSDGANPYAGLIGTGNTRYGTASLGGASGNGTVFAVNVDGTGFTNLHSFTYSDGAAPWAGLILSGHTLYGTAMQGGRSGNGTVFAINTDGTGFTNLHVFTAHDASEINADGACPNAGLILSGHYLYGTASKGGSSGYGTVFKIATNGVGFLNLHSFNGSDGAIPVAVLTISGNTLYGTAAYGGISGNGTVFRVNTDATGFTMLYSFQQTYQQGGGCYCPLGYISIGCTCVYLGVVGGVGLGPNGGGHGCNGFCGE